MESQMHWIIDILTRKKQPETVQEPVYETFDYPHVVWIHGANQTSLSFGFLKEKLPHVPSTFVEYSSYVSFNSNLKKIIDETKNLGPIFVIGHSLGGIYGIHLINHLPVLGGISISTPFRGSSMADWARFLTPRFQLLKDIGRKSPPILEAQKIDLSNTPWTQLVTTGGNVPWMAQPNDSVVTIASMKHLSDRMEIIEVPENHYEVVCSNSTVKIIEQKLRYINATESRLNA
jgi:pimeloyl-ACP methyl ester carboxylesterase